MQRRTKTLIAWGCGSVVTLVVLFIISVVVLFLIATSDNRIATDPELIAEEADFDLPEYVVVSQFDNMDRSASAWSSYSWVLKLKSPMTEDELQELHELVAETPHWSYDSEKNTYHFYLEEAERNFTITIDANIGRVTMDYDWWDMLS